MIEIEDKEKVIDHIRKGASTGIWCYEELDGKKVFDSGVCHSKLFPRTNKGQPGMKFLASASAYGPKSGTYKQFDNEAAGYHLEGYQVRGGEDISKDIPLYQYVQEYLRWLCSPESPYRNVHKNDIELVEDDKGNVRGFILGPSALTSDCNFPAIFNFCIANRVVRDYAGYLSRYGALRHKLGLDALQAFILMPYFSYREGQWVKTTSSWDGSHLPLKEASDMYQGGVPNEVLDIQRLKNAQINNEAVFSSYNTQIWMSPNPTREQFQGLSKKMDSNIEVKTRFSKVLQFTEKNIVEFAKELI